MDVHRIAQELRHAALAAGLFVALVGPGPLGAQGPGSISGSVTTKAGALRPVRVTIDQKVCGQELPDEAIVTDASGGVAHAVVTLAGVRATAASPAPGILNEKCRFAPRVQVARPQATVTTSSRDPILHTTNAQVGSKVLFNVAVPVPGIAINRPIGGPGLVRLGCNTHPWMRGWVIVTDEVAAVTDAQGRYTLSDVPAGSYELRIWHESLKGASQQVKVTAGQAATANFVLQ